MQANVLAAVSLYSLVALLLQTAATTGERIRWRMRGAIAIQLHRHVYASTHALLKLSQGGSASRASEIDDSFQSQAGGVISGSPAPGSSSGGDMLRSLVDAGDGSPGLSGLASPGSSRDRSGPQVRLGSVDGYSYDPDQRMSSDLDDFCRLAAQRLFSSYVSQGGAFSTVAAAIVGLQYVADGVGGGRTVAVGLAFAAASAVIAWVLLQPVATLTAEADRAMGKLRFAWDRAARHAEAIVLGYLQGAFGSRLERLAEGLVLRRLRLAGWMVLGGTWSGFQASFPWVLCYGCIALGVQAVGMFVSCSHDAATTEVQVNSGDPACSHPAGLLRGCVGAEHVSVLGDGDCSASAPQVAAAATGAASLIAALCALPGLVAGLGPLLGAAERVSQLLNRAKRLEHEQSMEKLESARESLVCEPAEQGNQDRDAGPSSAQAAVAANTGDSRRSENVLEAQDVTVCVGNTVLCSDVSFALGQG